MSKCLDPFRFLLISLAGWMNQQWPISTRPIKPRVVVTAATLVSVMNGWRAGGMRRVHAFGVSCLIRGVSRDTRRLANPEVSDGDATLGWPWDSADRVFGPYAIQPADMGRIIAMPDVGGLHHRYERRAA